MKANPSRRAARGLALALALTATVASHAAEHSRGLRVVSSQVIGVEKGVRVETRISRGLGNGVLSAQELRIALVAADGSVRAEQRRVVSAAHLSRHSARDIYLSTEFDTPLNPQDRVQVEWVSKSL